MASPTMEFLRSRLPDLLDWTQKMLGAHAALTRPTTTFAFQRLPLYFNNTTLAGAKAVVVDRLPVVPVAQLGFPQLADWATAGYAGITFLDTYFVLPTAVHDEGLHFHELIHIVQWKLLGVEAFALRYAQGLFERGYRNSPLEGMAYTAEERFRAGDVFDAETLVVHALRRA